MLHSNIPTSTRITNTEIVQDTEYLFHRIKIRDVERENKTDQKGLSLSETDHRMLVTKLQTSRTSYMRERSKVTEREGVAPPSTRDP